MLDSGAGRSRTAIGLALVAALGTAPLAAQQLSSVRPGEAAYVVPRIEGEIVLDGKADEPAWQAVEPLPVYMHFPTFGDPPTERTEFRLAYDSEYLYFSCESFDSSPEEIRMFSLLRDERSFRSDFCSLYIDTLNDEENSLSFRVGPGGNRSDSQRWNDAERNDSSWDSFWDGAAVRDEGGWYSEFRIPFSSMLFQVVDGQVVMGISMLRNISRKNERHVHPAISPDRGRFSYAQSSQMRKVVFRGIEPQGNPAYVRPYALAGGGYSHSLNGPGSIYERSSDRVREAGADFRVGLTSNLTLDLTANTDFAQVEADDQQVNLTRFSLFFPEKRRFFQERSSNFEFSLGGNDRLFHSRTIGLAGGQPVRIYGGGRLVGRVGEWDLGVLNLQTAESSALPSENLGVARLRRRVLNSNSYVGGIFTSRLGSGGSRNIVYGADAILRLVGDDYLILNWSQSFEHDELQAEDGSIGPLDRALARLNWERRGQDGLTYLLDLARAGAAFDPGMGFLRRTDYSRGQANLGYGWRFQPGAPIYTYAMHLESSVFRRNATRVVETVEIAPRAIFETWGLHQLTLSGLFRYENLPRPFSLPEDTSVPEGIYRFAAAQLQYSAPQGDRFRTTLSAEAGQFFDGTLASLSIGPVWDPSPHLNLTARYQVDRVEFDDRGQSFTSHLMRLRAEVTVSTRTTVVGFVQYNKSDNAVVANLRFRYNPREGNDFYVVWNEGLVTDRYSFDPVRPFSDQRTILIKYSHTLQFGI